MPGRASIFGVCAVVAMAVACVAATRPPEASRQPSASQPLTPSVTAGVEPAALAGITEAHNRVRRTVGVPPLKWNSQLAETARRWANACVDEVPPRGMIDHNTQRQAGYPGPIGENIFATTAPRADPVVAVNDWASESKFYNRRTNSCVGGACGHYTQLVWSATREVGCGVGSCPKLEFRTTLVCNYWPAGNFVGERPFP